jgi:hypothetical protein
MLHPPDLESQLGRVGLSIGDLQADRSIIYILDADLRIVFCNWSWDRFAFRNGGAGLDHLSVLGKSVMDVTPESLHLFYRGIYSEVRRTGRPSEHDFQCSSPEMFRLFHMRILPLGAPYLCIENSLSIERSHLRDLEETSPTSGRYLDDQGIIAMCCHCRRTRRVRVVGPPRWDWVPEFLNYPPGTVSHGLCLVCRRFFYPKD